MIALLITAVTLAFVVFAWGVRIMSVATDNLTAAVTRLSASVDNAVTKIGQPVDETPIVAATDALNAASDKLDAAAAPAV